MFGVVFVDDTGDRCSAVKMACDFVAEGGVLILHNSDRPDYLPAIENLIANGFTRLDFHGLGTINAYAATTSISLRSNMLRINGRSLTHVTVSN